LPDEWLDQRNAGQKMMIVDHSNTMQGALAMKWEAVSFSAR